MIGVDWGTTSLRAYLMDDDGNVVAHHHAADGIMAGTRDFHGTLLRAVGPWLDEQTLDVVLCGMVTSRQGWVETPYVLAPTNPKALAKSLVEHRTDEGLRLWFAPGVRLGDDRHTVDVMRGEETQVLGCLDEEARENCLIILPGTHSKWIVVENGEITWFSTFMTGEVYAALRHHTILRETLRDSDADADALRHGVRRGLSAGDHAGGLLRELFAMRVDALFNADGYLHVDHLSGLLVGMEIGIARAQMPQGHASRTVEVIGGSELVTQYLAALEEADIPARRGRADAAAAGMFQLARSRGVV